MAKKPSKKNNFFQSSIADFLKELGSESASPGGGAAAALIAATGVSLVEMVSRINEQRDMKKTGKKTSANSSRDQIKRLIEIRKHLGRLMVNDAKAFSRLSSFSKEKRMYPNYEAALQVAASIPRVMAKLICETMSLAENEITRTSPWLKSDLDEAVILLQAAFSSARLTVEINLTSVKTDKFRDQCKEELGQLQDKVLHLAALFKVAHHA